MIFLRTALDGDLSKISCAARASVSTTGCMMRVLLMFAVACGGSNLKTPPPGLANDAGQNQSPPALAKDDAVLEAVLLHEIGKASVANEVVCVTTRGATDATAVVAAIHARVPAAVPDRECSGGGPVGPVTHTATGGKAVRFDVGPVKWLDETNARVNGGGGHRGGGAIEIEYAVVKTGDGWKVTSEKTLLQT
jgi:hypothetical protein